MPIISYLLIVGSALAGLLFYADRVIAPSPLPFSVSQQIGLPPPYKAAVVPVESKPPAVIAATVEPSTEIKKPHVAVRNKQKVARVARRSIPQERFAGFAAPEHGSIW